MIEAISSSIPPIPLIDRTDQLVWHFNSNGDYSVKSGYHIAHNSVLSLLKEKPEKSSFQPNKGLWKVVWTMYEGGEQGQEFLVESV